MAGAVVVVTSGDYSDYQVICLARVLKDFRVRGVAGLLAGQKLWDRDLASLLMTNGYLEEIGHEEFNLDTLTDYVQRLK